ncbi:serine/threonine protein kinase [Oscillatoria acuminata]|uniref:non-specific serine/threonine protein kinase n=1 Tax=Oscillatoria acuminata PCC 6304 TaxID=56110 RepID=K9TT14_9CYAN|nr:serine/threonine-protein kinase [Oscillatoria acuminata]AFY85159.1 serine/threonine protein kinase [Oscillatoria acuminata PCC 6304]
MHQPGEVIKARYRILNILGQGGIATTYAAEDLDIGQDVAIKILSLRELTDWKVLELFEREGKVLSQLNHPTIPNYLDYFQLDTDNDRSFCIVQEIAPGHSLEELVERGWHPTELELRDLAQQILEILSYLHQLNPPVVHRDIKPQNIIRESNGKVFLVDFGAVQDTYFHTLSQGGTMVGTYGYMPPEQFRGQAEPATDLYGLGATLLFLLSHQSPADFPQNRLKIDFRPYVTIYPELADWLEGLLEPLIEDRFKSAPEALAVLHSHREIVAARLVSNPQPARSSVILQKINNKLSITIPSDSSEYLASLLLLSLSAFFLFMLFPFLQVFTSSEIGAFFLIFLLIVMLSMGCFGPKFVDHFVSTQLEFQGSQFKISWSFLGLSRKIKGNIQDIFRVQIYKKKVRNHNKKAKNKYRLIISCVLQVGVKSYHFGYNLTQAEKEWLVTEMANFLGKPKVIDA